MKSIAQEFFKKMRQPVIFVIALVMCFAVTSQSVFASFFNDNSTSLSCSSGNVEDGKDQFFSPQLIKSDYTGNGADGCGSINDHKTFFSLMGCTFVSILNSVFSKFYCAIDYGMQTILVAVITLYVVIVGMKLLMGMQQANTGATIGSLFKIGIVISMSGAAFLGSGMIFVFFSNVILNSVEWVGKAIACPTLIQDPLNSVPCMLTTGFSELFTNVDEKIYSALVGTTPSGYPEPVGGLFTQSQELALFFISLSIISPFVFTLVGVLIWTALSFLVRTIVSLLMCLIVVAFLVSLSPIFFCFILFGSTYSIFDNWLKFLISYSIQPALVFAIFLLWATMIAGFMGFVYDLQSVMTKQKNYQDAISITSADEEVMFCPLIYQSPATVIKIFSLPPEIKVGGNEISCCKMIWKGVPYPLEERTCEIDANGKKIPLGKDINQALTDGDLLPTDLMSTTRMMKESRFIAFIAYNIISALAISFAFLQMLRMAPSIAAEMSGAKSVLPLGAGFAVRGGGLHSMVAGFSNSIRSGTRDQFAKVVPKAGTVGAPVVATTVAMGASMADTDPFKVGVGTRMA